MKINMQTAKVFCFLHEISFYYKTLKKKINNITKYKESFYNKTRNNYTD